MKEDLISRRDFLNGVLVSAGSAILGGCAHSRTASMPSGPPIDLSPKHLPRLDVDPRALRGGNLPSIFRVAHWMRDQRLSFQNDTVWINPSPIDETQGSFPIQEDPTQADVIIVGSGISGLSSAFYLSQHHPKMKILILDANANFGGNAGRDDHSPIPVISSTAAAYAVAPYDDFLKKIYRETGLNWESHIVPGPFYSYYFDKHTPYILPNTAGWNLDTFGKGLKDMPYPRHIIKDFENTRKDLMEWYERDGAPTDPPDRSDPKFDDLAEISFHEYLIKRKNYHPAVSDFYSRYTTDALAGTCSQISAHSAIGFLGSEYHPRFVLPGGNSGIARHFLRWLVPDSLPHPDSPHFYTQQIQYSKLDQDNNRVRVRQQAILLRADTDSKDASVTYFHQGRFLRANARNVILATQSHSAKHCVEHLIDADTKKAWKEITLAPAVVANVTLRTAAPLIDLKLGFNQFWWGSKRWACFTVADWIGPERNNRDRETVLTFYDGNSSPPEAMPTARAHLMSTPFSDYETSIQEDLTRVLKGTSFDFEKDVSAIYLYRWGHALVYSKPGFLFDPPSQPQSAPYSRSSVRYKARKQIGRISFAGQDLSGTPSTESAIGSGLRAAGEVLGTIVR